MSLNWMQQRDAAGLQLLESKDKQRTFLEARMVEDAVANVEIPATLKQDLEANPRYTQEFFAAVARALFDAQENPQTAMRVVTTAAYRERLEMCYELTVEMRRGAKRPLKECFRALSSMLRDRILLQRHRDDVVGERMDKSMAALDGEVAAPKETLHDGESVNTDLAIGTEVL